MKLSVLVAAISLAASSAAFADVQLGTLSSGSTAISGTGTGWFDFTLSSASSFSGQLSGSDLWAVTILDPSYNYVGQTYFSSATSSSFSYNLGAGSYEMLVYLYPGQSPFTGSVNAMAAPVPEASNYAMLALGVAGVGVAGTWRRRRSSAALVA